MKAYVGVDAKTKLIHSVAATAANVADSRVLPELLHGKDTEVWGDQTYQGQAEVIRQCAPSAEDRINRCWRTKLKTYPEVREENRIHSKMRSRVEHVFALINQVRLLEGALPRAGEKHQPAAQHLRSGQPRYRPQTSAGSVRAELRLKQALSLQNHPLQPTSSPQLAKTSPQSINPNPLLPLIREPLGSLQNAGR